LFSIWLGLICGITPSPGYTVEVASIVYASFGSYESADLSRASLESRLNQPLQVSEVHVKGRTYYRVHGRADENIARARIRLSSIRKTVASDAWLQINSLALVTTIPAVHQPTPPIPQQITDPSAEKEGTKPKVTQTDSVASTGKPEFRASPSVGTEATSTPIFLTKYAAVDIKIDGQLDEAIWNNVDGYDNMTVIDPDTMVDSRYRTETKLLYTDKGLYVGTQAEQPTDTLIPRLSSRDQDVNRDGTYLYLDTSGEGLYGMFFGVNLGGSLVDGTMLPERQFSSLWDGSWSGSTAQTDTGYSTEMFLPWSMMSMPESNDVRKMGISISRRVAHLDEYWSWPALPYSKPKFMSALQPVQLEAINPRQQWAIFPFYAVTQDGMIDETAHRAGVDLFWRPSSDMQLTATLNPDFGTVESDDVVVNLTAFETFFPEKRLFFLEGNEIFITSPRAAVRGSQRRTGARQTANTFVLQPTTLINTRRIGGPPPEPLIPEGMTIPDVELGKPTELAGAVKVTGQKGTFRYGAMAAFEEDARLYGSFDDGSPARIIQDGRDFGVVRFLYENSDKGHRSLGWMSTMVAHPSQDAVTHGLDSHYRSPTGKWYWDGQLLASDVGDVAGYGGFVDINYIPRQGISNRLSLDYFDDKLDVSDLGFIRRNDALTARYSFGITSAKLKRLRYLQTWITLSHEENTDGLMVRSSIYNSNTLIFHNKNQLGVIVMYRPDQWDDRNSEGNGSFKTEGGWISQLTYGTDTSKKVSASIGTMAMTESLGSISYSYMGGITYKPNDRFSLDVDLSYRDANDWLVYLDGRFFATYDATHWQPSIAIDLFLTAKQQLRFSLQWVGIQAAATDLYLVPEDDGELIKLTDGISEPTYDFTISRLTTQLRYRWEIAPLSDLFIVYTRGSNLPNRTFDDFDNLFDDALNEPLIDMFVVKLRYRFGS
jgi:hypothetical protein